MTQCQHYSGFPPEVQVRCTEQATHMLVEPDGTRRNWNRMCYAHAKEISDEYAEKLGQVWKVEALDETD